MKTPLIVFIGQDDDDELQQRDRKKEPLSSASFSDADLGRILGASLCYYVLVVAVAFCVQTSVLYAMEDIRFVGYRHYDTANDSWSAGFSLYAILISACHTFYLLWLHGQLTRGLGVESHLSRDGGLIAWILATTLACLVSGTPAMQVLVQTVICLVFLGDIFNMVWALGWYLKEVKGMAAAFSNLIRAISKPNKPRRSVAEERNTSMYLGAINFFDMMRNEFNSTD